MTWDKRRCASSRERFGSVCTVHSCGGIFAGSDSVSYMMIAGPGVILLEAIVVVVMVGSIGSIGGIMSGTATHPDTGVYGTTVR